MRISWCSRRPICRATFTATCGTAGSTAAGINPYRYIPDDPHLAALRDPEIFPEINRARTTRVTIYPPAAQAIFFAVTRVSETLTAMKLAMVGFEAVAVVLLLRLLAASRAAAARIAVYAWHPLPLWEFAGSGHIDAALIAFVVAGPVEHARHRRAGLDRALLARPAATLVKFYPAVLVPALWRRWDWQHAGGFRRRGDLVAYLPFLGVGWQVLGFLPQYVAEEGFGPAAPGFICGVCAKLPPCAPVGGRPIRRRRRVRHGGARASASRSAAPRPDADIRGAALLAGAFTVLLSPHYPWYFAWLIVFACLVAVAGAAMVDGGELPALSGPGRVANGARNEHRLSVESVLYVPFAGAGRGRTVAAPPPGAVGAPRTARQHAARCRRPIRGAISIISAAERGPFAEAEPVCLYLETTNRCNLLCTTCPRTFEALEPPGDMSWELFTAIVDQFPNIARVVLHGVGEPMMVPALPRMIRYLKDRGTYVLFNTNGTLLTARKGRELIDSGLDELRVSLDAAEPDAFKLVRGRDMFGRIVRNVRAFRAMQRELAAETPRVSLWLTGLKETVEQLGDFVRLAHDMDVPKSICSASSISPRGRGWRGRTRRCSPVGDDDEGRADPRGRGCSRGASGSRSTPPARPTRRRASSRARRRSPGRCAAGRGR